MSVCVRAYLVARGDDLFDDDAVGEDQHLGDGGEEHAGSLHHARPLTERRRAPVQRGPLRGGHVRQLGDGITWGRGVRRISQSQLSANSASRTEGPGAHVFAVTHTVQ